MAQVRVFYEPEMELQICTELGDGVVLGADAGENNLRYEFHRGGSVADYRR